MPSAKRGSSCLKRCVTPLDWTVDAAVLYVFCSGGQLAEILIFLWIMGTKEGGVGVACGSERFKLRPPEDQTT